MQVLVHTLLSNHMKIIRLNARYEMYKKYRHVCGLRFETYDRLAIRCERHTQEILGPQWDASSEWRGAFSRRKENPRPYFITFKTEEAMTAVLLTLER